MHHLSSYHTQLLSEIGTITSPSWQVRNLSLRDVVAHPKHLLLWSIYSKWERCTWGARTCLDGTHPRVFVLFFFWDLLFSLADLEQDKRGGWERNKLLQTHCRRGKETSCTLSQQPCLVITIERTPVILSTQAGAVNLAPSLAGVGVCCQACIPSLWPQWLCQAWAGDQNQGDHFFPGIKKKTGANSPVYPLSVVKDTFFTLRTERIRQTCR